MKKDLTPGPSPFRRGEKAKKNGILNRARKDPLTRAFGAASPATERARRIIGGAERDILTPRAGSGPSPSSSPLQGEGKSGKGKARPPKRVPIDPIPYNTWKIKKLPSDLKQELDRMLTEGTMHSCRQLAQVAGGQWVRDFACDAFTTTDRNSNCDSMRSEWRPSRRESSANNSKTMTRKDAERADAAGADAVVRGC